MLWFCFSFWQFLTWSDLCKLSTHTHKYKETFLRGGKGKKTETTLGHNILLLCVSILLKTSKFMQNFVVRCNRQRYRIPQSQIIGQLCFCAWKRKSAKKYNSNEFASFVHIFLRKYTLSCPCYSSILILYRYIHSNDALYHPHKCIFHIIFSDRRRNFHNRITDVKQYRSYEPANSDKFRQPSIFDSLIEFAHEVWLSCCIVNALLFIALALVLPTKNSKNPLT